MGKKQVEESLNYKKYRTLSKVPDDILKKYHEDRRGNDNSNKKTPWKYRSLAVVIIVAILGIGLLISLGKRDDVKIPQINDTTVQSESTIESNNILMADAVDEPETAGLLGSEDHTWRVFGSWYFRDDVGTITFLNTLESAPDSCWDVSYDQSGTVFAWVDEENGRPYDLYIAAEGGVKGGDCHSLFAGYSSVKTINFNGCFDTSDVTYMDYMFAGCRNLTSVDAENLNTENVTDMDGMFLRCMGLTVLELNSWDTQNLIDAGDMFKDCESLEMLHVNEWDTSNVTNMSSMFSNCLELQVLDVSGWNTSNVENMRGMFYNCEKLTTLDVSTWNTSNVKYMDDMFPYSRDDLWEQLQ